MSKDGETTLPLLTEGEAHDLIQKAGPEFCVMGHISTPLDALLRREAEAEDEEGT